MFYLYRTMMVYGGYTHSNQGNALMKKIFLFTIMTSFLLSTTSGCYAKGPWHGKVIDAETKQPIEGAVVVAVWDYRTITLTGGANSFLDAKESTTNANGQFEIPAQSYLSIPLFREVQKLIAFTIYKPGYGSFPESVAPKNKNTEDINKWSIKYESMFKNEEDIVELPVAKTIGERIKVLHTVEARIAGDPKAKMKNLIRLIDAENAYLNYQQRK